MVREKCDILVWKTWKIQGILNLKFSDHPVYGLIFIRKLELKRGKLIFLAFFERETIRKYVLKILLKNSKNWLSYS